jgi:hypothetical protein
MAINRTKLAKGWKLKSSENQRHKEKDTPAGEVPENEVDRPGWVKRYLELADVLIRRRKRKTDDDADPKVA